MFDGRIAENFKLLTGTWVAVGSLRTRLLSAAGGVLSDAVIAVRTPSTLPRWPGSIGPRHRAMQQAFVNTWQARWRT